MDRSFFREGPSTLPNPSLAPKSMVAVGHAENYDPHLVDLALDAILVRLGGIEDIVRPGSRVAIKINLTGPTHSRKPMGLDPVDTYVTHPQIVRALVEQVKRAGASEIFVVEAVNCRQSFEDLGYEDMTQETGARLIDLNDADPYEDFMEAPVCPEGLVYRSFIFNRIVKEADVFMSVCKMKSHFSAGVTLTMKNLVGLVPYRFYRLDAKDAIRSAFHGDRARMRQKLPRIIIDLVRARPIDFALVDGICTVEGGEGPWISRMAPTRPGVLIAGRDCVAVDAVATSIMGFDPTATCPNPPFLLADNHLNIARAVGLGTNDLREIEIVPAETPAEHI